MLLTAIFFTSCYRESILLVNAHFVASIEDSNRTAPVSVQLENLSTGADFFRWTFEGGTPASSSERNPGVITYSQAGTFTIVLEAWNNTERDRHEFTFTVDSAVHIGFETEILINDFAPAYVKITNTTEGASNFLWTFEGGFPETSTEQHPGNVFFAQAGEHRITLTANNGNESFVVSQSIVLQPTLNVDFEIEPWFDDFDYEAPFTANLINNTRSGLTFEWSGDGISFGDARAENTTLHIASAGIYTVTLTAGNGQETKSFSREITIKENSNLYTVNNVKFGIRTAANTIGYAYSLPKRAIIRAGDIDQANGEGIALVFSGLNASFAQCFFVSPHYAENTGFHQIPNASRTYFVNRIEESNINFTASDFDNMTDDSLLRTLDIKSAGATNGSPWFDNTQIPRFVLFETADGIKGVIKIKAFVSERNNSYILTDIKHQKTAR